MKVLYVTFVVSVLLIVGGFFCLPMVMIDGRVLNAIGLLLMFATIEIVLEAIKTGQCIKL